MKKFLAVGLAFVAVLLLCSGCSGTNDLQPSVGTYRVLERDGEPEYIENYGIESFIERMDNTFFENVQVTEPDYIYAENSLFLKSSSVMNKEDIESVYGLLGVENHPEINDLPTICSLTGLYAYNKKIDIVRKPLYDFELGKYPKFTVIGYVSNVYVYPLKYTDLSAKDGSVVAEGSFEAILCGQLSVGTFSVLYLIHIKKADYGRLFFVNRYCDILPSPITKGEGLGVRVV